MIKLQRIGLWLALALTYLVVAKLSLLFAFEQSNTSPVWPPTGIAIAALMRFGLGAWPGILLGSISLNLGTDIHPATALAMGAGNTLEAVTASYLIHRYLGDFPFARTRDIIHFSAILVLATSISATIGVSSLLLSNAIEPSLFARLWATWWLGDLIGGIVICPLLICWASPWKRQWHWWRTLEVGAITLLTLMLAAALFTNASPMGTAHAPIAFIFLPMAIWSAYRFYQRGATLYVTLLSAFAIIGTLYGYGPFVLPSVNSSLLSLQAFMGVIALSSLTLAASIREKERSAAMLLRSQQQLVTEKDLDLEQSAGSLRDEIAERNKTTAALHTLLQATSLSRHDEILQSCVRDLANIYKTRYAILGELVGPDNNSIRTRYVWANGQFVDNFEYQLANTPCQDVLDQKLELISENASSRYPKDLLLGEMTIDSYFGAPIITQDNKIIGILVVMDDKPLFPQSWSRPILALYAKHLALELDRHNREEETKLAETVFRHSFHSIAVSSANGDILRVNPAFEKITGFSANELIGKNFRILKSDKHSPDFYHALWHALINRGHWHGEIWNRRKNGELFPAWQSVEAVYDSKTNNIMHFVSIFSDISEQKLSEENIYRLAHFDPLTTLNNRTAFHDHLTVEISHAKRHNTKLAVLYLDLDHFKLINDASGHAAGDTLLRIIADRLRAAVRDEDIIGRLGGDEFVLIITNFNSSKNLTTIAQTILGEITRPMQIHHNEVTISASIGISSYPGDGEDGETLLKNADAAMYQAKQNGRNNFQFFTQEMNARAHERLTLENHMRKALINGEFFLEYQPQISLQPFRISGCEALVRWMHPERGVIAPNEFIPIAEDSGLIRPLGEWIMREACLQQQRWEDAGLPSIQMAVNLSSKQFLSQDLLSIVKKSIDNAGIAPTKLELELTESAIMEAAGETMQTLDTLKEMGVQLSIDDFGTGYSSMLYLKQFPIDKLKIDRSFVQGIVTNPDDVAIVNATISLAKNLRMDVIAEGAETLEQVNHLRKSGCNLIQGYYFSRPIPADQLANLLAEGLESFLDEKYPA